MSEEVVPGRPLTEAEQAVLDLILSLPFQGREQVRAQLQGCLVRRR